MRLSLVFKALSDETRREILRMLHQGDLTAGEIAERFSISRPSISHHLNVLKQASLVEDLRKGQNIYYSLNTTVFQDLLGWFLQWAGVQDQSGPAEGEAGPGENDGGFYNDIAGKGWEHAEK